MTTDAPPKALRPEDTNELQDLIKLISSKKSNLQEEGLTPREAHAVLEYIDSLEADAHASTNASKRAEEPGYNRNDLDAGLRKLVGIAATPPKKAP